MSENEGQKAAHSDDLKFYAPGDKAVLIASTHGGHTFGVSPEGSPVPKRFHRDALAAGCMPEAMKDQLKETNTTEPTRIDVIEKAIDGLMTEVDNNPELRPKLLTGDGRPDSAALSQRCGFKVAAAERDQAWDKYQLSLDE